MRLFVSAAMDVVVDAQEHGWNARACWGQCFGGWRLLDSWSCSCTPFPVLPLQQFENRQPPMAIAATW